MTPRAYLLTIAASLILVTLPGSGHHGRPAAAGDPIRALTHRRDAVLVCSPTGEVLTAVNEHRPLIPASILKIVTALTVMDMLGTDYRFPTEIYLSDDRNLLVKGYGDPLLTSEIVEQLAARVADRLTGDLGDLLLDDTYFTGPLAIPGVGTSANPYDAPNGALCVNFNTVNYRIINGRAVSAEPQTPLIPFARDIIRRRSLPHGRVVLSHDNHAVTRYAGHLLAFFMARHGIRIRGRITLGRRMPGRDRLLLRHESPFTVDAAVARLLEYSNNFVANQLLIAAGAKRWDPPGSLDKAARTIDWFASRRLAWSQFQLVEGSGISRKNRISATHMMTALAQFAPHHSLLPHREGDFFKTGTLTGIRTRAGFLLTSKGLYRYVVMLNSGGQQMSRIMTLVRKQVAAHHQATTGGAGRALSPHRQGDGLNGFSERR